MHKPIICVTFDDFSTNRNNLSLIEKLKERYPKFKTTMFTVPMRCTQPWLDMISEKYPYIEMAQHGYLHYRAEFGRIDYKIATKLLNLGWKDNFTKGFKAPSWKVSEETIKALKDLGYWLAIHPIYDKDLKLNRLPYYVHNAEHNFNWEEYKEKDIKSHGHLGNELSNSIENCMENLLNLPMDREFKFASECLKEG